MLSPDQRNSLPNLRRSCGWTSLVLAVLTLVLPQAGWAQAQKGRKTGPELEKISGKIKEIDIKGKAANLVIDRDDGGEPLEILVTAKLKLQISAPADVNLLAPKQSIVARGAFESNKEWFAKRFEIYHGSAPPVAGVHAEQDQGGSFLIAGALLAHENGKLLINAGGKQVPLNFEQGANPEITVYSSQIELAREGSAIEVEGSTRAGKFLPQKVAIHLENPLTPEDFAPRKPEKKTPPPKTAGKSKKGTKDPKTEDEPEAPAGEFDPDDPFGVNKKGGKPAPKTPGTEPESPKDQG